MKIEIKKISNYQSEYSIIRNDGSVERTILDTKTYLLHDICHYVVEKHLKYSKGIWGMLSAGHSFKDLVGKHNPNTVELRFIEQIVGPVQSTFLGNISKQDLELFVRHLDFTFKEDVLNDCLSEIESIINQWKQVRVGQQLTFEWKAEEATLKAIR